MKAPGSLVLVVEDESGLRGFVQHLLELHGYRTIGVSSVAAALDVVRVAPPDSVLCDYHLPDGSGLDVLRSLRFSWSETHRAGHIEEPASRLSRPAIACAEAAGVERHCVPHAERSVITTLNCTCYRRCSLVQRDRFQQPDGALLSLGDTESFLRSIEPLCRDSNSDERGCNQQSSS